MMGKMYASCGHDITHYPWDWPGVWTKGWHESGWVFSTLCFSCILDIMATPGCVVQFTAGLLLENMKVEND